MHLGIVRLLREVLKSREMRRNPLTVNTQEARTEGHIDGTMRRVKSVISDTLKSSDNISYSNACSG